MEHEIGEIEVWRNHIQNKQILKYTNAKQNLDEISIPLSKSSALWTCKHRRQSHSGTCGRDSIEICDMYERFSSSSLVLRSYRPNIRVHECVSSHLYVKKNIHNIHELEQHRIFFSFFFLRRCVMLARSRLELSIYSRELWANVTRQKKIPHPQAGRDIQVKQLNYRRKEISSSRPGVECIRDCMEVLLAESSDLAYIFLLFHTKTWDIFPHLITLLRSTLGEAHSDFSTSTYDNDEFSWSEIKPSLWVFIHTWEFL